MKLLKLFFVTVFIALLCSCGVYSFRDTAIDYSKYKTIKINLIENKARYINPLLANKITDVLQQKVLNRTKLIRTNNEDAHLQITGYITNYDPTQTVGISNQQSTTNRLTVTVHIIKKDLIENKTDEFDISRNFDFSANSALQDVESALTDKDIVPLMTDDIFNKLFSNW